ncbi:MAG: nitrogenase, partial [Candidatus Tectomicrobia bacterium]|nr:nitrogenase [Candidatus Tectomicrobia bacterium]
MAEKSSFVSNRNACKLCTPLGACLAFRGIKGAVPLTHGSQGCATYIRRYIISHFKEPMDVASSNFSEEAAIFGGGSNLKIALQNVTTQYNPSLIGISTTCLSETIGDDVPHYIRQYQEEHGTEKIPTIIHVSTPSYRGTHMDGFHAVVRETIRAMAGGGHKHRQINLFPGFVSPADMRYLKEIMIDFDLKYVLLPDYSETLDAPIWAEYEKMAGGGTSLEEIKATGRSRGTIEFGRTSQDVETAGKWLWERFRVPDYIL